MGDVEVQARLSSALDVCEREAGALDDLRDPRLVGAIEAMSTLRAEIVAALASLTETDQTADGAS